MLDSFYVARKINGGKVSYLTLHPNRGQEWHEMVRHVMQQQADIVAYQYENDVTMTFRFESNKYCIVVSNKGLTVEYRGFWLQEELTAYAKGELT